MADGSVRFDITADDSDVKKKLDGVEDAAQDAASGMDELDSSSDHAGKSLSGVDIAAGTLVANGLTALISGLGNVISTFAGMADETREYREDMAKLETAFTSTGHTTDTANKAYEDFYAILGESDRSVEAVNHLAELTDSEAEVAKWSDIAAGVTAKFGDSLPIEGLTEAANETAKVAKVTGPLADAINWASSESEVWGDVLSGNKEAMAAFNKAIAEGLPVEDAFNTALAEMSTEQERSTAITETLNGLYKEAGAEYNELTASAQAARRATSDMEKAQAELGAAIEPVTTAWMQMKADALQWFVDTGLPALQTGFEWIRDNLPVIGVALAGITGAWLAFGGAQKIATAATTVATAAQAAYNAVLAANPVGFVILAITALVAAFILLWKNCEGFREFWIELWEKIKQIASDFVIWAKETWTETIEALKTALSNAWDGIKAIWDACKEYFTGIWNGITGVFSGVATWFGEKFLAAYSAVTNIWDAIKGYFEDTKEKIIEAFDSIKDDFFSVGDNIITGIWDGISAGWDWLTSKVSELASSLFEAAKDVLDINSPSRKFAYVGEMSAAGFGKGWDDEITDITSQVQKDLGNMTVNARATVSAENNRIGQFTSRNDTGMYDLTRAVGTQTAGINSLAGEYRRGNSNTRPIVLMLDRRELGRAFVDVGNEETARIGVRLGGV